jgi:hypothetical protein
MLFTPVAHLPPVSLIQVAICHRRRWHRLQICRRYRWHQWKIGHRYHSETGGKICPGVVDTGGAPWLANISVNFWKNLNDLNGILWDWRETDSWKKTRSKKSRDTVPLNWLLWKANDSVIAADNKTTVLPREIRRFLQNRQWNIMSCENCFYSLRNSGAYVFRYCTMCYFYTFRLQEE